MKTLLATFVWAVLTVPTGFAVAGEAPLGKKIIEPFDFHGVTLEDGPMLTQVKGVLDRYLQIPDDDLLKGFRQRAGRPAPGNILRGWYVSDTFHVFGQIVSGLARLHAATGDPAAKEKVNRLVKEWGRCIEPDGFFFIHASRMRRITSTTR